MELRPGARRALEVQGRQAALQHRREQSRATLEQAVPGQVELFKRIPGYRMDVYPTRRTCSAPDFVVENTRQNVGFAKLDAAGLALDEAHVPGIPFPMPSTGAEVMWNMKMRYRGVGVEIPRTISGISPRKGGNGYVSRQIPSSSRPGGKRGVRSSRQLAAWRMRPSSTTSSRLLWPASPRYRLPWPANRPRPSTTSRPAPRAANAVVLLRCATDRPG